MVSKYDRYWRRRLEEIKELIEDALLNGYSKQIDVTDIMSHGKRNIWGTHVKIPPGTAKITEELCYDAHGKSLGNVIILSGILENLEETLVGRISKVGNKLYLHFETRKTAKSFVSRAAQVSEEKEIISATGKSSEEAYAHAVNGQRKDKKTIIYIGDAGDVIKRILTNHCSKGSNVEASALRRHVAEEKGYRIKSTRRTSGSMRVRIDLPNPRTGEMDVSDYIRSGEWGYAICNSYAEANDFQWYAIVQLKPLLNKDRKPWNFENLQRHQSLLAKLTSSPALNCDQLHGVQSGPGVYVFYHQRRP